MLFLIRFYRRYISPARPPCCRFIPTCSDYAMQAIGEYGAWKGGWLTLRRLLRCNPFHRQKSIEYDPIPKYKKIQHPANTKIPAPGRTPGVVDRRNSCD